MTGIGERGFTFPCRGETLVAVAAIPEEGSADIGVLIIVGGEQYRIGGHRQFTLLARALAAGGIPCMRFDCRGMGDSTGDHPGFETMNDDIRAAVDAFQAHVPSVSRIVLWGLCDGASAACLYAPLDDRVKGAILLNPWVRTEKGEATTILRRYYLRRFIDPEWWKRIVRGEWRPTESLRTILDAVRSLVSRQEGPAVGASSLAGRMASHLDRAGIPFALVLSGEDMVAMEFVDLALSTPEWDHLVRTHLLGRKDLPEADHTFATADWSERVTEFTAWCVKTLDGKADAGPRP